MKKQYDTPRTLYSLLFTLFSFFYSLRNLYSLKIQKERVICCSLLICYDTVP
jgi:hypothetical protein